MAKVTANVLLTNPETHQTVSLLAGDDVPAWATGMVGEHLIGSASDESKDASLPEGEPSEDWKGDQLKAYAEAHNVDLGSAKTKAEIVAAIDSASDES